MPSIANQDFKIYGKLSDTVGVPAKYCGELYAAISRNNSFKSEAEITDGYVITSTGDSICRQLSLGFYFDFEEGDMVQVSPVISQNPAYYDALWAIQQAAYAFSDSLILGGDNEFGISDDGNFVENEYGTLFINEDGYLIKGTEDGDGKLASLYLGDKADEPGIVIRLESLLPLVGELPLNTPEIW